MRHVAAAFFVAGSLTMGGCGTVQNIESNLASPTTTKAAANVEKFVTAFACGLSQAAAAAQGVESTINSKGQTVTNIVYVSSAAGCKLLGGVSQGAVSVPASAVTAVQ